MMVLLLIIASIVNIFLGSSALHCYVSYWCDNIYGLTAYDTSHKRIYVKMKFCASSKKAVRSIKVILDLLLLFQYLLMLEIENK